MSILEGFSYLQLKNDLLYRVTFPTGLRTDYSRHLEYVDFEVQELASPQSRIMTVGFHENLMHTGEGRSWHFTYLALSRLLYFSLGDTDPVEFVSTGNIDRILGADRADEEKDREVVLEYCLNRFRRDWELNLSGWEVISALPFRVSRIASHLKYWAAKEFVIIEGYGSDHIESLAFETLSRLPIHFNPKMEAESSKIVSMSKGQEELANVAARAIQKKGNMRMAKRRVFIVHGHDKTALSDVRLLLSHQGIDPVVLAAQANRGRTLIEKLEAHTDGDFAIVLLTPDDRGRSNRARSLKARARQNVILELGYLMGKLGRAKVACMVASPEKLERPSDMAGMVYIDIDRKGLWKSQLGKELEAAGFKVDFRKLVD